MSDLVARLRATAESKAALENYNRRIHATTTNPTLCDPSDFDEWQSAALIEQQAAKIAELERERDQWKIAAVGQQVVTMAARDSALEEAAKVAEGYGDTYSVGRGVARAIRSLKQLAGRSALADEVHK